jgi:hypothetical protein
MRYSSVKGLASAVLRTLAHRERAILSFSGGISQLQMQISTFRRRRPVHNEKSNLTLPEKKYLNQPMLLFFPKIFFFFFFFTIFFTH